MFTIPQMRKDKMTAGPAMSTAGLSITKMPAQIVLPKPIIVACKSPRSLFTFINVFPPRYCRLRRYCRLPSPLTKQAMKRASLLSLSSSRVHVTKNGEFCGGKLVTICWYRVTSPFVRGSNPSDPTTINYFLFLNSLMST